MGVYVFDIDGTLSQNGLPISESLCRHLERLAKEHRLIFASARPIRDMLPMVKESLHQQATFIGCNCGMAFKDQKMFYCRKLDPSYVESTLKWLNALQIPYVLDGEWGFSLSSQPHHFHQYIRSLSSAEMAEDALLSSGVTKILVLSDTADLEHLVAKLTTENISIHIHSKENFFDITCAGNNKYHTIRKITEAKYTAFGNDKNDFLMLENAEKAIFVGSKAEFAHADIYLTFDAVMDFIKTLSTK